MAFERICCRDEEDTQEALQDMANKLNYAEEHMPPKKKTVEEFLAMDMAVLNDLLAESISTEMSIPRWGRVSLAEYTGWCWTTLRPEIRKRGYKISIGDSFDSSVRSKVWFSLNKGFNRDDMSCYGEVEESTTITLAHFLCACYLYVMQEIQ